jgi:hypothetical protein
MSWPLLPPVKHSRRSLRIDDASIFEPLFLLLPVVLLLSIRPPLLLVTFPFDECRWDTTCFDVTLPCLLLRCPFCRVENKQEVSVPVPNCKLESLRSPPENDLYSRAPWVSLRHACWPNVKYLTKMASGLPICLSEGFNITEVESLCCVRSHSTKPTDHVHWIWDDSPSKQETLTTTHVNKCSAHLFVFGVHILRYGRCHFSN